jgi:hypothetical protein
MSVSAFSLVARGEGSVILFVVVSFGHGGVEALRFFDEEYEVRMSGLVGGCCF